MFRSHRKLRRSHAKCSEVTANWVEVMQNVSEVTAGRLKDTVKCGRKYLDHPMSPKSPAQIEKPQILQLELSQIVLRSARDCCTMHCLD